jgi:site-specific recombinase XerD
LGGATAGNRVVGKIEKGSSVLRKDLGKATSSLLAAGGCDIITLQNILGHKTLSITQRYAHLIPGRHDERDHE